MKITSSLLSIPPYISTPWKNITSLHTEEKEGVSVLIVSLHNKTTVEIPNLDKDSIKKIFETHANSLEAAPSAPFPDNPILGPFSFRLPFPSNNSVIDSLGSSMEHNEAQANLPPLAADVLKKISMVARAFGLEDLSSLPSAKPDCNCVYCQVIRTITEEKTEEEISEADLKFQNWKIEQTADKLYLVTNPLDPAEHYNVYLGDPIGCTCGKKHCEHIREVLNT
jgi:hypothetical protein